MKKLNLLILVSLLCAGLVQAQDADDPELQALIKTYKAMKAQQNATPKAEDPKVRYEKALIQAARAGNASQVRGLLEAGTNPNVTDEHGNTPLIYGAKESAAIVDMLLYAGADVNAKGENGITPLINSFAVTGPEANTIRTRILKAKPDVNAVMNGYICEKITSRAWRFLDLHEGRDDSMDNESSCKPISPFMGKVATALSFAVATDDINAVQTLLKNGADANIGSVLVSATQNPGPNSTKIVELLLKTGADPWIGGSRNYWENTVYAKDKQALIEKARNVPSAEQQKLDNKLALAAEKGKLGQVKKLLAKGANPNGRDSNFGNTPLFNAVKLNSNTKKVNLEVVKVLLEAGANPNINSSYPYNNTPFMAAMGNIYAKADVIKTLIDAGANINARNNYYATALHLFAGTAYEAEKVEVLIQAGADVNARDVYGRTPLFNTRTTERTQFLINAGANINATDYEGYSALFRNYVIGNNEKIELLQKNGARLTAYEKKRLPFEKNREELGRAQLEAKVAQYEAENKNRGGIGQTLLQGLSNAVQDTANYAINNAGKF